MPVYRNANMPVHPHTFWHDFRRSSNIFHPSIFLWSSKYTWSKRYFFSDQDTLRNWVTIIFLRAKYHPTLRFRKVWVILCGFWNQECLVRYSTCGFKSEGVAAMEISTAFFRSPSDALRQGHWRSHARQCICMLFPASHERNASSVPWCLRAGASSTSS